MSCLLSEKQPLNIFLILTVFNQYVFFFPLQMYPLKLKGISICFSMLKAALCGSYVNFGVFRLYGDDALDNALNTFVKLLLSIPQSDLLVSDTD